MSLTVAIQMDPMESVDIDADSTFALALEAERRGHTLSAVLRVDVVAHLRGLLKCLATRPIVGEVGPTNNRCTGCGDEERTACRV